MNALPRFSSLRAAGEGALAGCFCGIPIAIGCYFIDRNAGIATAAYLAVGMSMGGMAILVAHCANRRSRLHSANSGDAKRLAACEARCVALQAALMACASAAGPDTLRLVSTQYNMMLEYAKEKVQ